MMQLQTFAMATLLFLQSESDAYKEGEAVGRVVGMVMVAIIIVWGIVKLIKAVGKK